MIELRFIPNISVGPFVFGTEREEVWKMMKNEFGTERELPTFEREYYKYPNVFLEFIENKLMSVSFADDYPKRYCDIYFNDERIWPRTQEKFFSIFEGNTFVDVYGSYMSSELSITTLFALHFISYDGFPALLGSSFLYETIVAK